MAMTILKTVAKAGKNYQVDYNGAKEITAQYQVVLSSPLNIDEVPTSFTGVPAIGSEHPDRPGCYVTSYDVSQPDGSAKNTLDITVHYSPSDISVTPATEEDPEITESITEWGWDDGTGERELLNSVETFGDPVPVVNSAGDPFESAPMVSIPTPTFTKVFKSSFRRNYTEYLCAVNDDGIQIGAMYCPPATLLCTVAERRLIGETKYPYEYTVRLRYRSNIVSDNDGGTTEIGWNVALVDAGMREIANDGTGKLKLIQVPSNETGEMATVTSPELLDGQGQKVDRSGSHAPDPYILTFNAYVRKSFPTWMYSEPAIPQA